MTKAANKLKATDDETTVIPAESEQEFTPEDITVMNLLEDIGADAGAKVRIYRQGKSYQDITLLAECTPAEFDPIMLAHPPYNGGDFRIHIRSKTGIVGNRLLKVAPGSDAITPGISVPMGGVQQNPNDILGAVRLMMDAQAAQFQLMLSQNKVPTDPMQTFEGIAKIAELMKPAAVAPQTDDFVKTMKGVELVLSMSQKFNAPAAAAIDADGELNIPGMVMSFLREMRGMQAAAQPAAVVAVSPNGIATPALPAPAANPPVVNYETEDMEMNILLKYQLRQANAAAAEKVKPEEYAETLYPMIPEGIISMLASNREWFAVICEVNPDCAQYQEWYAKVVAEIKKFATEDGFLLPTASPPGINSVSPLTSVPNASNVAPITTGATINADNSGGTITKS